MIQKNELKIGNLVYYNNSKAEKIIRTVDWKDLQLISEYFGYAKDWYEPIELTKEILSMCGFKEDMCYNFYINVGTNYLELMPMPDGFYPVIIQPAEISSEPEQSVGLIKINYLHQLQNLFYFLTGEELNTEKIKL